MKRLIALLLCIFISLSLFTSCDKLLNMSSSGDFSEESSFDSGFDFDDDSGLNNDSSYTEDSSHKDSSFGDSSSNGDSSSDDKEEGLEFITSDSLTVEVGSTYQLEWVVDGDYLGSVEWSANNSYASVSPWGEVLGYSAGSTTVTISNGYLSDSITIEVVNGQSSSTNPYLSVNQTSFYANYTPAKNLLDAQYRSQAYLMSGDISDQDQAPTIANNRPIEG
ncbi:MAG: Ig-like domain-containing protein, partial [Clostridia bacterium]|nr:Ig-like domain-containing protein [Clostridia bacterium]